MIDWARDGIVNAAELIDGLPTSPSAAETLGRIDPALMLAPGSDRL
jgi:hypothetical protein